MQERNQYRSQAQRSAKKSQKKRFIIGFSSQTLPNCYPKALLHTEKNTAFCEIRLDGEKLSEWYARMSGKTRREAVSTWPHLAGNFWREQNLLDGLA